MYSWPLKKNNFFKFKPSNAKICFGRSLPKHFIFLYLKFSHSILKIKFCKQGCTESCARNATLYVSTNCIIFTVMNFKSSPTIKPLLSYNKAAETLSATTKNSCRKSHPARKCKYFILLMLRKEEKLLNYKMQSYLVPVFRHTKLWPCFIVQEKHSHFTEKSELWALRLRHPKRDSVLCHIIHHSNISQE